MCGTCGCGRPEEAHGIPETPGDHVEVTRRIEVERSLLADNDLRSERLRKRLAMRGIEAIGLMGGPGAGKTTLLEATFERLGEAVGREAVVEGDCASDLDAQRIAAAGARVTQIATGGLCHLDAHLVGHALEKLELDDVCRLWIENVGNLVCPAPFPCGESRRAMLISTPEGDDKPSKYPATVMAVDLLVITKVDLLPHVRFDVDRCVAAARRLRPKLPILSVSALSGEGMEPWMDWVMAGGA
jgi:hydrogenase nickel incorporation protein HypB